jgi:hypothetical protein
MRGEMGEHLFFLGEFRSIAGNENAIHRRVV